MSYTSYILVGPAPPYRGGIANYNYVLAQSLSEQSDVEIVNFSYLYPGFLFPGKTQFLEDDAWDDLHQSRRISSINPMSWYTTARYILDKKPAAVIFQWWHPFFAMPYARISKKLKTQNIPAIYICHNVEPHESTALDELLLRHAYKHVDRFIVHSSEEKKRLEEYKPKARIKVNVHPEYTMFPSPRKNMPAPIELPESRLTLLYFGLVRPYKGVHSLIEAMAKLKDSADVHLMIVGEFYDDKSRYLDQIQSLNLQEHITIVDQYIPNEEVGWYFKQADVVVLPYLHATQSGVIPIAYHFRKPVIATNVGGLPDVVFDGETGFLVPPDDPTALAEKIVEFQQEQNKNKFREGIEHHIELFSWNHLIQTIEALAEN